MATEGNTVTQTIEDFQIKQKILDAASRLYEQKGLYETSVAEIAEAAGISVPVTYHYVSRKSDIMLLIMEDLTNNFKGYVEPKIKDIIDPKEKLCRAIELYYQYFDQNLVKVILVYRESRTLDKSGRKKIMAAEMEHVKIIEDIIKEGIAAGVFRNMDDTDMVAHNIVIAGHTWALKSWHYHRRVSLAEYTRRQIDFFLQALSV